MAEAVIVDSVRTGLAKSFRGGFNQTRADDMTAHIIDALMDRNPKVVPELVEDVILGCGDILGVFRQYFGVYLGKRGVYPTLSLTL